MRRITPPATTAEAEEQLLSPLRAEAQHECAAAAGERPVVDFDPGDLPPDQIDLELEVGPSVVCVYGGLIMNLYDAKVRTCHNLETTV